ncbi:MAG: sulfurtransferase-like selenium metabolism protein YedF [Nitrospiraceae bacterium]|nr:sulfurtransferase-like selenium metabolism protein YedF [Nitrospiraceae bacterium]
MIIDARGLSCPKPVLLAQEALAKIGEGIVEVLVDNYGSADNLVMFAQGGGCHAELSREGADFRVKIVKGYLCQPAGAGPGEKKEEPADERRDILMVVASDQLGKEENLGRMLMKGFFETMKVTKEVPHTVFFLNAGVKLTTLDEEMVPVLKEIERMGAEIFSCGTCLKYYGLESSLKVGYRGTTNNITDGMADRRKTVWIG